MISCQYFVVILICCGAYAAAAHKLKKRYLIFPRQAPTRHQFIGGIGIPADLDYESLVVGHVLKAMFYLPYNATVFRENPYLPEYKIAARMRARKMQKATKPSQLRWDIYAYLINRLNSYGYNGQECMLRTICEANSLHFESNFNVFAELLHILLSPSSSLDAESNVKNTFIAAEKLGNTDGSDACSVYACKISLLNFISTVLHIDF